MINRKATAIWKGTGKEGTGVVSTQSTVLDNTQYSFNTRFEDGKGTKLSFELNAAGFTADELDATATVTLDPSIGKITKSHIDLKAKIPGISKEQFAEVAEKAKQECPISAVLNAELSLDAELI